MKIIKQKLGAGFLLFIALAISVFAISSANYTINYYSLSSGGGVVTSANYSTNTILGTITGVTNSSNYTAYLGFFFGGGGSSTTQSSNAEPLISFVSSIASPTPTPGGVTSVNFWFVANDSNGATDLVNSSSTATFTMSGETTRSNSSCTGNNDPTTYSRNFTCTVGMLYYDGGGTWSVNVTVNDTSNVKGVNDTVTFTYNFDLNINLSNTSLTWAGAMGAGDINKTAASYINVSNIGNVNITNISITSYNLLKDGVGPYLIGAGNFSVTNLTGALCNAGLKDTLINNTEKNMTSEIRTYRYTRGKNITGIYYCLNIPTGIPIGVYNTTNQWQTKAYG